jgi:putative SOS response-associated peptidase YedK
MDRNKRDGILFFMGIVAIVLFFLIFLFYGLEKRKIGLEKERIQDLKKEPYFVFALDSSRVLVIPDHFSETGFMFFRDQNRDGYAETKGSGFFMLGLSEFFEEYDLDQRCSMDSLKNSYSYY